MRSVSQAPGSRAGASSLYERLAPPNFILYSKPYKKDRLVTKFGLDNKESQLSCFLNTSLQAMWNLPMMRNYWRFQSEETKGGEKDISMTSLMKMEDNVLKELKVRVFR